MRWYNVYVFNFRPSRGEPMTEADPVERLCAALAGDPRTRDLPKSVRGVQDAVSEWWRVPYMTWFTDHGPDHSRRVAENALLLAEVPNLSSKNRLSSFELYILL